MQHHIITPRNSWWEKLREGLATSSPQVKQALIAAGVALLVAIVGWSLSCWSVYTENSRLKAEVTAKAERIQKQEGDLAALRHENQKLDAENNRWRLLLNPIERKAKEIYPELETSAAVAKLAKDLEDTRNLATRSEFKPLKPELREQLVSHLKERRQSFVGEQMVFVIGFEKGNLGRAKLAEQLLNLFKDAGMLTRFTGAGIYSPETFETPVRVFLNLSGPGEKIYRSIGQPLSRFLTSGMVPLGNPGTATNEIHFQIMGTPGFLPDGSVVFE